jgi:hypothetical protein
MITYFCGKDNLDERLKLIKVCFILLCPFSKIMSFTKPKGFEECCPGVTRSSDVNLVDICFPFH